MFDILLVSLGASLGANVRYIIYRNFQKLNFSTNLFILIINTFSSFCLGLFLALLPQIAPLNFSYQLVLFFSIGFLGSLSSFSTFAYDLFNLFLQLKYFRAFKLFIFSTATGLMAFGIGFLLGNQ